MACVVKNIEAVLHRGYLFLCLMGTTVIDTQTPLFACRGTMRLALSKTSRQSYIEAVLHRGSLFLCLMGTSVIETQASSFACRETVWLALSKTSRQSYSEAVSFMSYGHPGY